jgi:hypothetical protein
VRVDGRLFEENALRVAGGELPGSGSGKWWPAR